MEITKIPAIQPEYRVTGTVDGITFSIVIWHSQLGSSIKRLANLASKTLKKKIQPDCNEITLISISRIAETSWEM